MNSVTFYQIVLPFFALVTGVLIGLLIGRQQRYSKWRAGYSERFRRRISGQLDKLKEVENELRGEIARHISDEHKRLQANCDDNIEAEMQARLIESKNEPYGTQEPIDHKRN